MLLAGFALTIFLFNPPQPSLAQRGIPDSDGNGEKISPELQKSANTKPDETMSVLVQLTDQPSGKLHALLNRSSLEGRVRKSRLDGVGSSGECYS